MSHGLGNARDTRTAHRPDNLDFAYRIADLGLPEFSDSHAATNTPFPRRGSTALQGAPVRLSPSLSCDGNSMQ